MTLKRKAPRSDARRRLRALAEPPPHRKRRTPAEAQLSFAGPSAV